MAPNEQKGIRAEGEIIVDDIQLDIPPEAQSGDYTIVVGVYLAENGLRLAVADAADDRWRLPMPLSVTTGEQ